VRHDFVKHFAAGVDPVMARVMHAVQQPLAASTLQDVMGRTCLAVTSVLVPRGQR
jgi:uncharacterized membrane protein YdcZ (DUF606 family)